MGNTPPQFAEQIKAEYAVYKDVVQKAKLTLDGTPSCRMKPPTEAAFLRGIR